MFACQITRTFVQPTDTHIFGDALRGCGLSRTRDLTSPAAFSILGDVTDTWHLPTGRETRSVFPRPTGLPGILDTAHVVDAVLGDEAFFVALHTYAGALEVHNPFLFLGFGQYLSDTRLLAATDTRRGTSEPGGSFLVSLVQQIAGELAGATITRHDLVGDRPVPWRGRRDVFAYDDTVAPDDPMWRQQPSLAGDDIVFDMAMSRPLVSTVEVAALRSARRAA